MEGDRIVKNKNVEKLSIEMVFRRSFSDIVKDYVKNCSLAGAQQICDPNIGVYQRTIWIAVFCAAFGTACYFLQFVWTGSLNKPLIVSLESTVYPIEEMNFPAVAICSTNRISRKALNKFALQEYKHLAKNESLQEVEVMLLNLGRLIDYSYNATLKTHPLFMRMVDRYRVDRQKTINIMEMLAPDCDDILLRCAWRHDEVDCNSIFQVKRTANRGHCCTFNSFLTYNEIAGYPNKFKMENVKRQQLPGFQDGLVVLLDPLVADYAYPLSNFQGFDILIFDALHFADPSAGKVIHQMLEPNSIAFMELKSTKQIAAREVRKYPLDTRKCLFHDESHFYNMYSYSTCIVYCRIATIQSLCKCTPFFMAPNQENPKAPVCTLEDLFCLNKYKEKLFYLYPNNAEDTSGLEMEMTDSLRCPDCLPDCEAAQYFIRFSSTNIQFHAAKSLANAFFRGFNMSGKSVLSVYYPTHDCTLVRLDVVSYWYEILSNVGGFCGIIVGFSIISVAEIIYYFTIQFVWRFRENFLRYR